MSIKVISQIWDCPLPTSEKMILLVIADHADEYGGNAWPSIATIARKSSMGERQVQRYVKSLVERGLLSCEKQAGGTWDMSPDKRPNRYTVNISRVTSMSPRLTCGATSTTPRGVTSGAERGDTHDASGVTPMTPNPYIEPSIQNRPEIMSDAVASDLMPSTLAQSPHLDDARRLCQLLADLMVANGVKRPTITTTWIGEMDRLMRLDDRSPEQVEATIRWSQNSDFWKANIHSPTKLRAKYDQLRLQSNREVQLSRPKGWKGINDFLHDDRSPAL